jgi:hypothetical protein
VSRVGFFQAGHVLAGNVGTHSVFQARDFAQDGPLLKLEQSLIQRGLGLLECGRAVLGISAVLGGLLLYLVAEIFVFCLGVTRVVQLLGGIEFGDQVAFLDARSVRNQPGQGDRASRAIGGWDDNFRGMHRVQSAGKADFALRGLYVLERLDGCGFGDVRTSGARA